MAPYLGRGHMDVVTVGGFVAKVGTDPNLRAHRDFS